MIPDPGTGVQNGRVPKLQLHNRGSESTGKPEDLWCRGRCSSFCLKIPKPTSSLGSHWLGSFGLSHTLFFRATYHFLDQENISFVMIGSVSKCPCHSGIAIDQGCLRNGIKLCEARILHLGTRNPSPIPLFASVYIANLHADWPSMINR